jgi:hypothetical protein
LEWLIVADFAQIVGGKLYLQGGGWNMLTVNRELPVKQTLGIAASFLVPWDETNQRHRIEIDVMTEDGRSLAKVESEVQVGRPAEHPPGQPIRAQLAGNMVLELNEGNYAIVGRIEGEDSGDPTPFSVVAGPVLRMQGRQQGNPPAPSC